MLYNRCSILVASLTVARYSNETPSPPFVFPVCDGLDGQLRSLSQRKLIESKKTRMNRTLKGYPARF